jgi:hypothetical protein
MSTTSPIPRLFIANGWRKRARERSFGARQGIREGILRRTHHLRLGRERHAHRPGEDLQSRAPFGSFKQSGFGREIGLVALDNMQVKNVVAGVNRSVSSAAWHVYDGRSNPPGPKGVTLMQLSYQRLRSVCCSEVLHSRHGPQCTCAVLTGSVYDGSLGKGLPVKTASGIQRIQ